MYHAIDVAMLLLSTSGVNVLGSNEEQMVTKEMFAAGRPYIGFFDREEFYPELYHELYTDTLQYEEQTRAASITHRRTREQYIAGRAVLRLLIFSLTGMRAPPDLFAEGATGPPIDIYVESIGRLIFSISHSSGKTLLGLANNKQLGVDIEAVRPVRNMPQLATYAFTISEAAWLDTFSPAQAETAFFRTWTRKEAVIKYYRGSIANYMDAFSVPLTSSAGIHTLRPGLSDRSDLLYLHDFELAGRIYGAACIEDYRGEIEVFKIELDLIIELLRRYRRVCG